MGDLVEPGSIERLVGGVRTVFHLAGKLFVPGSSLADYERIHVDATQRLLQACISAGSLESFVLCSTTGVHGPTGTTPAHEDDPGRPQNAYEVTKLHGERVARELASSRGAPLVVARPGLVYGPGDRHLLGWFSAIRNGYYRVIGPGTNCLHPIYIDDLVRAMLLCADVASPEGRAYHLVGARPVTVRELSDAIGAAVGRRVPATHLPAALAYGIGAAFEMLPVARRRLPLSRMRVRFLTGNRAYDGTLAHQELGFTPRIDLADGLTRTVAWYREAGWL